MRCNNMVRQKESLAAWSKASSELSRVAVALHAHVMGREQVAISSSVEHLMRPRDRTRWTHRLPLMSVLPQLPDMAVCFF